jgi:hypothetical protein
MNASERVAVVVDLVPLERLGRKPTVKDLQVLGKQLLEGDPIVVGVEVISESRYYYGVDLWQALFGEVVFDSEVLKIKTKGLSTASLRALLLHTKRLKG